MRDRRLNHRPEVLGGVLEAECAALLDAFFADHRLKRTGKRWVSQLRTRSSARGSMVVSMEAYSSMPPLEAGCMRWLSPGRVRMVASGLPVSSVRISGSFCPAGTCRTVLPKNASTGTWSACSAGAGSCTAHER